MNVHSVPTGLVSGVSAPQTFASEGDRERLTPAAAGAVRNLSSAWNVTGEEMAALLAVSPSTWDRIIGKRWNSVFNQDQLTRISCLVGIYKGLHLLFADDMADRWIKLKNAGPLFGNKTPIEAMVEGGIPLMIEIRRYIDGLRGGL